MPIMEKNWAGNLQYSAAHLHTPTSAEQVAEIVRTADKVRALGSRHSFNSIADTTGTLLSTEHLNRVLALDAARARVTVEAGAKYGQLCAQLDHAGFALHNLASLPHISIAGACATATHGSGVANGNLATAVSALELVTVEGQLVEYTRAAHGEQFQGMVVALGALGIVTKMTLDLVPAFHLRQDVYQNLALAEVRAHFDAIVSAGYSVSLFTDWRSELFNQVWLKRKVTPDRSPEAAPVFYGATPAVVDLHPIAELSAENCTAQRGIPGAWYERLPHFRMDFTPSSGAELQSEYFVPLTEGVAALEAIARVRAQLAPLVLISEIRTIAADTLWLSPCYGEACMAIHFTWVQDWEAVSAVLPLVEAQLAPFRARPHWGKLFTMSPAQLRTVYPKLDEFSRLARALDPHGKFRNAFLDRYVFAD